MPSDVITLEKFGEQEMSHGKKSVKPIVNATSLEGHFDLFKKIIAAKRLKYESNQSSSLAETNKETTDGERKMELSQSVLTKTKIAKN